MRILCNINFLFSCLLYWASSAFAISVEQGFPASLYEGAFSKEPTDATIQIAVKSKKKLAVPVHSLVFARVESLRSPLVAHNSKTVPYDFASKEEAAAFKKVIYFLYKNSTKQPIDKTFFEASDLSHLISHAFKYDIPQLGDAIAKFLHEQLTVKMEVDIKTSILLDQLSKKQYRHLRDVLSPAIIDDKDNKNKDKIGWIKNIKDNLHYYEQVMIYTRDKRISQGEDGIDLDIYRSVHIQMEKISEKREKDALEAEVKKIIQKLHRQTAKGGKFKRQEFRVAPKIRESVAEKLQDQLPGFRVWDNTHYVICIEPKKTERGERHLPPAPPPLVVDDDEKDGQSGDDV